jgi:hypothetical protein
VRTNFSPFKSGDVVMINRDFKYVDQSLLCDEIYTIDQMFSDAGIVTLKGFPKNKTFPEDAFRIVNDRSNFNGDC